MKIKVRHIIGSVAVIGAIVGYVQLKNPPSVPAGNCTNIDASGCATNTAGTYLEATNPTHTDAGTVDLIKCTTDLLAYASALSAPGKHQDFIVYHLVNGVMTTGANGYPVTFKINFTGTNTLDVTNQIKLDSGCVGQSSPSVRPRDLIIEENEGGVLNGAVIPGQGVVNGAGEDALKIIQSAGCPNGYVQNGLSGCPGITISGNLNCGPPAPGAHSDAFQPIGGVNISVSYMRSGVFSVGYASCWGAGGGFYPSGAAPSQNFGGTCVPSTGQFCNSPGWPVNMNVDHMVFVSCQHGLNTQIIGTAAVVNGAGSTGNIRDSAFRAGQKTGSVPGAAGSQCSIANGAFDASGTNYSTGVTNMQADAPGWTFGPNLIGDFWCQTACSPGWVGYNPANDNL